jgi:hypothetical protein
MATTSLFEEYYLLGREHLTLKMRTVCSSETSAKFDWTIRRHIPEDTVPHGRHYEKPKPNTANITDFRFQRILLMVHNTQNYWVSGLCPSSGILKNRKHKFWKQIHFLKCCVL